MRARPPGRAGWAVLAAALALPVVLPVAAVVLGASAPRPEAWRHLWETRLPEMLVTTVVLLALVGAGTLVLGAGLAWLVTAYRFPGRRVFAWLLVLPLAMPAYVLGFVFLSLLDFAGPVQGAWRALAGPDAWFPDVRSVPGAAVVLTLTLYPYVFLMARAALLEQAASTFEAARLLGHGRLRTALRVVLPLARPSLAAGSTLVMMETLTDFATVQYFNVQTVSVGVYRVWKGMGDRLAATQLAAVVLAFALVVILAERYLRGEARFHQGGSGRSFPAVPLHGPKKAAASALCAGVLGAAFVVPVGRLVLWAGADTVRGAAGAADPRFVRYLAASLLLAVLTAAICVAAATLLANAVRLRGGLGVRAAARLATLGYAVPGPVVAIGVLALVVGGLGAAGVPGGVLLVTGSLFGVAYAYAVRFLAPAYGAVEASLEKVTPSVTASAMVLGAAPLRVMGRVHLPLMRAGLGAAAIMVLIEALKELPIVLLLRPFGFTTLSVWVWQLASESRWAGAGLPALVIVAVALVPVVVLFRETGGIGPEALRTPRPGDQRPPVVPSPGRR